MRRRLKIAGCFLCLAAGSALFGEQGYLALKARLAERLIARAYAAHLQDGAVHPPWSWADTHPIGRLGVPRLGVQRTLLAGASGTSLAFGPGHISGTALPGDAGHSILGGHRDTHFAFLQTLQPGMQIEVQRRDGAWRSYLVTGSDIIDHRRARLAPAQGRTALTLVTCYPFDAVTAGGPLRFLVTAEAQ